jgi:hypothetical protein
MTTIHSRTVRFSEGSGPQGHRGTKRFEHLVPTSDTGLPRSIAERLSDQAVFGSTDSGTHFYVIDRASPKSATQTIQVFEKGSDEPAWTMTHPVRTQDRSQDQTIVAANLDPRTESMVCILRNRRIREYLKPGSHPSGQLSFREHAAFGSGLQRESVLLGGHAAGIAERTRINIVPLDKPGEYLLIQLEDPVVGNQHRLTTHFEVISLTEDRALTWGRSSRTEERHVEEIRAERDGSQVSVVYNDGEVESVPMEKFKPSY